MKYDVADLALAAEGKKQNSVGGQRHAGAGGRFASDSRGTSR